MRRVNMLSAATHLATAAYSAMAIDRITACWIGGLAWRIFGRWLLLGMRAGYQRPKLRYPKWRAGAIARTHLLSLRPVCVLDCLRRIFTTRQACRASVKGQGRELRVRPL